MTDLFDEAKTDARWNVWMTAAREAAKAARKQLAETHESHNSPRYLNTLIMIEILDRMGVDRNYHAAVTSANHVIDTILTLAQATIQQEYELMQAPTTGKPS